MCSKIPQPIGSLLSMRMRNSEILWAYTNLYWEFYSEIGGGNEQVAAGTFRLGLPEESVLKDSLTMRSLAKMHQLMRRIEEYKRLEDDHLQGKGKAPASSQYHKDFRLKKFPQRSRREQGFPGRVGNNAPRESTLPLKSRCTRSSSA